MCGTLIVIMKTLLWHVTAVALRHVTAVALQHVTAVALRHVTAVALRHVTAVALHRHPFGEGASRGRWIYFDPIQKYSCIIIYLYEFNRAWIFRRRTLRRGTVHRKKKC